MQRKQSDLYNNNGSRLCNLYEFDNAIIDFTKAIELNPKNSIAYNNRATAYYYIKEYDKAFSDLNQAIALDPDNANFYNNRGKVCYAQMKLDLAMTNYNIALNLNPNFVNAYNNRGQWYSSQNQFNLAMMDFDRAFKLDPELQFVHTNYFKTLIDAVKTGCLNVNLIEKDIVFEAIKKLSIEDQKKYLQRCLTLNDPLHEFFNTQRENKPCSYTTGTFLKIINYMKKKEMPYWIDYCADNSPPEFTQDIYCGNVKDLSFNAKAAENFKEHEASFDERENYLDNQWSLKLFTPKPATAKKEPQQPTSTLSLHK